MIYVVRALVKKSYKEIQMKKEKKPESDREKIESAPFPSHENRRDLFRVLFFSFAIILFIGCFVAILRQEYVFTIIDLVGVYSLIIMMIKL